MTLAFTGTGRGVYGCSLAVGRVCMPMSSSLMVETHRFLVPMLSLGCGAVGWPYDLLQCSRPPGKPTRGCHLLPWDAALPPQLQRRPCQQCRNMQPTPVPTRLCLETSSSSSGGSDSLESSSQAAWYPALSA